MMNHLTPDDPRITAMADLITAAQERDHKKTIDAIGVLATDPRSAFVTIVALASLGGAPANAQRRAAGRGAFVAPIPRGAVVEGSAEAAAMRLMTFAANGDHPAVNTMACVIVEDPMFACMVIICLAQDIAAQTRQGITWPSVAELKEQLA